MKDGILIGLIIALLIVLGIGWYQYSKLEDEFQIKQNEIESLSLTVSNLKKDIISLNKDNQELKSQVDSISKDKQELESQRYKFKFKDNIEDNTILLRDNLCKHSH